MTEQLQIKNLSPIPIDITWQIQGDGFMPAVRINIDYDLVLPNDPKEFSVEPDSAVLQSGGALDIIVRISYPVGYSE